METKQLVIYQLQSEGLKHCKQTKFSTLLKNLLNLYYLIISWYILYTRKDLPSRPNTHTLGGSWCRCKSSTAVATEEKDFSNLWRKIWCKTNIQVDVNYNSQCNFNGEQKQCRHLTFREQIDCFGLLSQNSKISFTTGVRGSGEAQADTS